MTCYDFSFVLMSHRFHGSARVFCSTCQSSVRSSCPLVWMCCVGESLSMTLVCFLCSEMPDYFHCRCLFCAITVVFDGPENMHVLYRAMVVFIVNIKRWKWSFVSFCFLPWHESNKLNISFLFIIIVWIFSEKNSINKRISQGIP